MDLFPMRTVSLASELPPAAVAELLRSRIGAGPAAAFAGSVTADGFVITSVREYRSTSMPRMRGRLRPAPGGGTALGVRLRPAGIVVVFMALWLGFLAAVAALIVAGALHGAGRSPLLSLVPVALAGLSWHVMVSVFAADARWAVESVVEALPALQRQPAPPRPRASAAPGAPGTCPPGPHLC